MGEAQVIPPSKGVPERQRGWGMLLEIPQTVQGCPSVSEGGGCWLPKQLVEAWSSGTINIPLRRFANLSVNPINIPLRRSAFATRRCPPSKEE